jgi:hypothetical protein
VNIVRALRHVKRTATKTDLAEAKANARNEQKGKPFEQHSRSTAQAERE